MEEKQGVHIVPNIFINFPWAMPSFARNTEQYKPLKKRQILHNLLEIFFENIVI